LRVVAPLVFNTFVAGVRILNLPVLTLDVVGN
jgi:hypothetical protein